jgi:hypothetical protein
MRKEEHTACPRMALTTAHRTQGTASPVACVVALHALTLRDACAASAVGRLGTREQAPSELNRF